MSEVKVNKISPRSGTTVTLGDSGDTFTLASGVSLTGVNATFSGDLTVDTNTLFVDSTNNRVGVGTSSPNYPLTVHSTGDGIKFEVSDTVDANFRIEISGNDIKTGPSTASDYIFQTGNTEAMRIDSSGNVGIGTSSPSDLLTIQSPASGGGNGITIKRNDNSVDQRVGAISFGNTVDTDLALIAVKTSSGNNDDGNLQFYTQPNGGSATERMRIDSSGNVLVGKTAIALATVGGELRADGQITGTRSGNPSLVLNRTTSDGEIAQFYKDATKVGSIGTQGGTLEIRSGDVYLQFNGANDWIKPVDGSGNNKSGVDLGTSGAKFDNLYLGGNIYLGGTGGANALDDYEEGTHTVSITGATSGSATVGDNATKLKYIKIGKEVWVHGEIHITGISSIDGTVRVSLPFTVADTTELVERSVGSCALRNINIRDDAVQVTPFCAGTASYFVFRETIDNSAWQDIQGAALSASDEFVVSLHYTTS